MAYNDDQNEFPLPGDGNQKRRSSQHLPRYFRTDVNKKFLASTLDQLMQPGTAEKLNGYFGRKRAVGYQAGDFYIGDVSQQREDYQFEPAAVVVDDLDNVDFYGDYNDYINQLRNLGSSVSDHSLLNRQEYYSWEPNIDWDKFVNFREYYWLPNGPQSVPVRGQSVDVVSTYTVTSVDNGDNYAYVLDPNGFTQNPEIKLYRGITYRFEIDTPGLPLSFRSARISAPEWRKGSYYQNGERVLYNGTFYISTADFRTGNTFDEHLSYWEIDTQFNLGAEVSAQGVEKGVIELKLTNETPDAIYYMSDFDVSAGGLIRVYDLQEATYVDVEQEIIGKKTYTTSDGWELSNGQKIYFNGTVVPESYSQGAYYVEGVGDSIRLVPEDQLNIPSTFSEDLIVEFDTEGFDRLPYSEAIGYPLNKDYITINRASQDGNLWSKYNRWFHKSVIELAESLNDSVPELDQTQRATRPIIEFRPNLKLLNFGTTVKSNIDLVDDFTKDVFSTIEGSQGYNVDGIDLANGMRILFTADPDSFVNGKIYEVKFITVGNDRQITLVETEDTTPLENEVVLCTNGETYKGIMLWYNGSEWKRSQTKTKVNQPPVFDIFDNDGNSLTNQDVYESTNFTGTKLFSYSVGSGSNDSELGFPLKYRSINNVGDIVFQFDLLKDAQDFIVPGGLGFIRKYSDRTTYELLNGWQKADTLSFQSVLRQYEVDNTRTVYPVDMYEESANLTDLTIKVFLNNDLKFENVDYTVEVNGRSQKVIRFTNTLELGDIIKIKTTSSAVKNENGIYEIATNLERNPLNNDIDEFTLGEINDHVGTMVENIETFSGVYPGVSNLRDTGKSISKYGHRIVKHSSPMNLSLYHLLDKDANVIKALKYARREYGKFKRSFLQTAASLGYDGPVKEHVDRILREMWKDKVSTQPFYFSDMVPTGGAKVNRFEIDDPDLEFFALSEIFQLNTPSDKAVQIYQNGVQLTHGLDYTFNDQGFAIITTAKQIDDEIVIYEYDNTNGSYVPPTPTKLGLYPKFVPEILVDDTYLESKKVIQGHDGSIVIAYDDYRDDLLLELERRIYNNLKVEYDPSIFDIYDFVPSEGRTTELTREQIDGSMISDFVQWLQLVDTDYTLNTSYQRSNTFTFNHQGMTDPSGNNVSGWWRAVYQWAYDTDRPHTHPWEMLGFTIKPTWWDEQYGSAPYTSNNLLMWEDIEAGIIREPNVAPRVNPKFKRPNLVSHIPVDESGNLVSPVLSSYIQNYNSTELDFNFVYGDWSPVETAWRRSAEYPFALITSLVLNQPSKVFSVAFDRIRQKRGLVGHIIYENPNTQIKLSNIVFPNTPFDDTRTFTSGLVNYVYDYVASNVTTIYDTYKSNLQNINNQIGFKLGGFTSKDKFKLILDSRTPLNQGNVFVPEENYKIFLNTSTPIKTLYYSGVIIEKQSYGFVVKGYNTAQPYFTYLKPISQANDSLINVGGISDSFVYWTERKTYSKGTTVDYEGNYYKCTEQHTSGTTFDSSKFARLPKLPQVGGREAYFRKRFEETETQVPYGTVFEKVQDVVDFLLGYGEYLETQGFRFDYYSPEDEFVSDWKTSAKEFMFWTTQNWGAGAVITLSPSAFRLKFISEYSVVDDIYDTFYGYSLLKADGKKLAPENVSLTREDQNEFVIKPKNTEDGIFAVRLALVQKEHVVLIDNKTVFEDIIYDQEPGYRQDRIKVLGYRTTEWDGSINIPGFIFDNAKITEWSAWTDYSIGDLVKYKEFYYSARNKISGTSVFNANEWVRLDEKPEMGLIPNFEYKTNQFADFYDLDTDNFDVEQQKFAQHLIGYQNRDYLANIINDDVSQYKFYQGMIQEKGTRNALDKLFDVLSSADKESLDFYEEWAIKVGQYGAADGFEEVEYLLDESKMRLSPQSFELVNSVTGEETDLVYRIRPFEVYLKPDGYDHAPFPSKYILDTYTKNAGYVDPEDVDYIVTRYNSILNIDFTKCKFGSRIWVGNENRSWNVYSHIKTDLVIESTASGTNEGTFTLNSTPSVLKAGDIIGVFNIANTNKFYSIKKIENNKITVYDELEDSETPLEGRITRLVSVRVPNLDAANDLLQTIEEGIDRIWIDETSNGRWAVYDQEDQFSVTETVRNTDSGLDQNYASAMATDKRNTVLVVGAPDSGDGKVFVYTRAGSNASWQLVQEILADDDIADAGQRFGASVAVGPDGRYIAIGSPNASNVKTNFEGNYSDTVDYAEGKIVNYEDTLWKALTDIDGAETNIIFGSFESVPQIMIDLNQTDVDDVEVPVILTGNYPFVDQTNVDHILVKAPFDMYEGSGVGDTLKLEWNTLTYANQDNAVLTAVEPFGGAITGLDSSFFTGSHVIADKIDSVLYVENSNTVPLLGQIVETSGGFGEVAYTYVEGAKLTIYVKNQNGTFGLIGSLTTSIGEFVGEYVTSAPVDVATGADTKWNGYWRIDTSNYDVASITGDSARNLVYKDFVPTGQSDQNRYYYNILNLGNTLPTPIYGNNRINSELQTLTYSGEPGPGGVEDIFQSNLFVMRAPSALTDALNIISPNDPLNDQVEIFYNSMPGFLSGTFKDPATIGLTLAEINKKHTVYDLWDGYIDIELTVSLADQLIEPKVGLTIRDVTNRGTALVTFYQKFDVNKIRLFVKNVSGTWALGRDFNQNRSVEWLADGSGNPLYDPSIGYQEFGQILSTSLGLASEGIGKMIVLEANGNVELQSEDTIFDGEYWFYYEENVLGIPRPANIPSENNNDWEQVFSLPATPAGTVSGLTNEGMYSVYERRGAGQFVKLNSFSTPLRGDNQYLGDKVILTKYNDLYRLFVKEKGDGTEANSGRIFIINNGSDDYYAYGWEFSRDKQYKGQFNISRDYFEDDIVYYDSGLYQAITNISAGVFNTNDWSLIENPRDYLGYIPNETGLVVDGDNVIDNVDLIEFGHAIDTSENGQVMVLSALYSGTTENRIAIYRNAGGNYYLDQTILAPSKTVEYGVDLAISSDGRIIAVGAPYDDTTLTDQGKVYIYKQVNGAFELSQELTSPRNDRAELFGYALDFDGNTLIISARNGDSFIETTFSDGTTFDNEFTKFRSFEEDAGIIRIYERIEDTLVYGQTIDFDDSSVRYFGRNILLTGNHIYVGMPNLEFSGGTEGTVVDFRKTANTSIWSQFKVAKQTVDIDKIKRVILYDTKENELITYLDYIDVLQGKVAGLAEQELSFKTYYDPATYNVATANVNLDTTNSWGPEQVGKVWWDLTNAKFINPYQSSVIYSTNNWNVPFSTINTIDVYEWVESTVAPDTWDTRSGTEKGLAKGITGTSKYGNEAYVTRRVYDEQTKTFTTYYYFWVKGKTTVPNIENRSTSVQDIADLIRDPAGEGYRFISFISPTEFALHNCEPLIRGKDIALSIQYWTIEDQNVNIHNQYQIITEGLETSRPSRDVEQKWFDSLVGYDSADRIVPSLALSAKEKYGILNRPRQGWFVNREEAVKQLVSRANTVLKSNLIVDDKDITRLTESEAPPSETSNRWDRDVDSLIDLQFVGVARARQAQITPVIENGKIVRLTITDGGRGYLKAPTVTVLGDGEGAEITTTINSQGTVVDATIVKSGNYYDENTTRIAVRRYTVLVNNDETLNGKWTLYERDTDLSEWVRVASQSYDVSLYWEYADWYADGYSQFTEIDHLVEASYELVTLKDDVGDIVKISNVGTGGWLLLRKINIENNQDYTVNYETIGRQNGTIQLKDTLYDVSSNKIGFDTGTFDTLIFDAVPSTETRIILETIRDEIFVDELAVHYNELFFASLRYVFAEQGYVDWAFKTSFIKAKHNVGNLEQKITFQNDNLASYEEYIKEVKPYKTKIREYLSNYEALDNSSSMVTDFDLPPVYNVNTDSIEPQLVKVYDDTIVSQDADLTTYPNKNWADNVGYKVTAINISDAGSRYTNAPIVKIQGGGGTGAKAVASLGREGTISAITVTNPGSGYITAPTVILDGSVGTNGREGRAIAQIGDTSLRTMHSIVKFDRVSGTYEFVNLATTEEFTASGNRILFNLEWPMDLRTTRVTVLNNGREVLSSLYTYRNVLDTTKGYDRYKGQIEFVDPPAANASIVIEYNKDIKLLKAQDRINLTYEPTSDQYGKTLGQLMDGVDYGGVEVRSFEFGGNSGWDTGDWFSQAWDVYDTSFEDEIFELDGSTISIELSKPLEDGETYNVYRVAYDINGQLITNDRMDDPDYDGSTIGTINNPEARMLPLVGDGETTTLFLDEYGIPTVPEDSTEVKVHIIIRKISSDGSFLPDPSSYDTQLEGGNLQYSSATGLNAEEINIDGDGFVTITSSKGPEEIVPGQVMDTLDIQVFESPTGGASQITSRNYIGDGTTRMFDLGTSPVKAENLFVKVGYVVKSLSDYTISYDTNKIVFNDAPALGARIGLVTLGHSANRILDIETFTGDGQTNDFLTNARWIDLAEAFVTVDGVKQDVQVFESDDTYEYPNNVVIRFPSPPMNGSNIKVLVSEGSLENLTEYSQVTVDTIVADGSTLQYNLSESIFAQDPTRVFTLVKVNNRILNPGYSQKFNVTSTREYQLDLTQIPIASINAYEVEVYLNGRRLSNVIEYSFEGGGRFDPLQPPASQPGSTVTLSQGIGETGDNLDVYIITDGDYRFGYFDSANDFVRTPNTLHIDQPFNDNDIITVYQFSNHDSQGINRQVFDIVERTELTPGSEAYYKFRNIQNGLLPLNSTAVAAEYVWVIKNGDLLSPSVDYGLTSDRRQIKLVEAPAENDEIQLIHFANQIVTDTFGWRQFKDMLNRTHYKRLQSYVELAQPLNYYDKTIEIVDASSLPQPDFSAKYPGVLFIEGERIEYFKKEGNTLRQIRRGTLGTGVKEVYEAGSLLMEQGVDATMPYRDESQVITVDAGGYTTASSTYENSPGVTVTSITYDFNNNTAFPLGGQVATVKGTGFTERVKVLIGDTEAVTTFVNDTTVTFVTPALPVGAYDLVIVNEATNIPIDIPQTSYVVPGGVKYVQILLPFAPIPNPATATGWYKDTETISVSEMIAGRYYIIDTIGTTDFTELGSPNNNAGTAFQATGTGTGTGTVLDYASIPYEYWEAQDIEVFVAGRRLRKTPIDVYNYDALDSPEGDITIEAEYAVNKNVGAYVRLTEPPANNTKVTIIRKVGTNWTEPGTPMSQAESDVARFLRSSTLDLPR